MPVFKIATVDGEELGRMEFTAHNWPVGSVIHQGADLPALSVVEMILSDDPEGLTTLVVEQT